jgi:hypothetical protein
MGPNHYIPVYKSETKTSNGHIYSWNKFELLTSTICKEEDDREIKIEFFKSMKSGKH